MNGGSAYCEWWPMWNSVERAYIYTLHFLNADWCEDTYAPNSTIIMDYVQDGRGRSIPPKKLMLWQRDLVPGLKYQIYICAWEKERVKI